MGAARRSIRIWVCTAAVCVVLVAGLQIAAVHQLGGEGVLPRPRMVLNALVDALGTSDTYSAIGQTLLAWALGFAVSLVLGVGIGVPLGLSDGAYRSARGLIDFFRAVPAIALLPLGVLILGVSSQLKVVLVVEVCIWPILLQTMAGIRDVEPLAREAGRSLRMSRSQEVRWILLPSTIPFIGTGARLAAVMAVLVSIGVELVAGVPGVGYQIYLAQLGRPAQILWANVVIAGVLGIVITQVFTLLERRMTKWHPSQYDR